MWECGAENNCWTSQLDRQQLPRQQLSVFSHDSSEPTSCLHDMLPQHQLPHTAHPLRWLSWRTRQRRRRRCCCFCCCRLATFEPVLWLRAFRHEARPRLLLAARRSLRRRTRRAARRKFRTLGHLFGQPFSRSHDAAPTKRDTDDESFELYTHPNDHGRGSRISTACFCFWSPHKSPHP